MNRLTTRNTTGQPVFIHPVTCERCGEESYGVYPDFDGVTVQERLCSYEDAESIPLTIDQLKSFDAEPLKHWIWIEIFDPSEWRSKPFSGYYRSCAGWNHDELFHCGWPGYGCAWDYADYGIKWLAFAVKPDAERAIMHGYEGWMMLNIYPQRAPNPNDLHRHMDTALHKANLECIERFFSLNTCDIWAAWGTIIEKRPYLRECLKDILAAVGKYDSRWIRIGAVSKAGHPHHPLYLRHDEAPVEFDVWGYAAGRSAL